MTAVASKSDNANTMDSGGSGSGQLLIYRNMNDSLTEGCDDWNWRDVIHKKEDVSLCWS